MVAGFEVEMKKVRDAYQGAILELKGDLTHSIMKTAVLLETVNMMATNIAARDIIIEELCECIDHMEKSVHEPSHVVLADRARELISKEKTGEDKPT